MMGDKSDGLGALPEHWYCVSRLGLATLCLDEEDAQNVAAENFVLYPQHGPYRAAQLVDAAEVARAVAAERERCAKERAALATAAEMLTRMVAGDSVTIAAVSEMAEAIGRVLKA